MTITSKMVVGSVRGTVARLRGISPAEIEPEGKIRKGEVAEVVKQTSELYDLAMELNGSGARSWTITKLGYYLWQKFIAPTVQQTEAAQPKEEQIETPKEPTYDI